MFQKELVHLPPTRVWYPGAAVEASVERAQTQHAQPLRTKTTRSTAHQWVYQACMGVTYWQRLKLG